MLVLIHTSLSLGRPSPEAALRRLDAERRLVDELRGEREEARERRQDHGQEDAEEVRRRVAPYFKLVRDDRVRLFAARVLIVKRVRPDLSPSPGPSASTKVKVTPGIDETDL